MSRLTPASESRQGWARNDQLLPSQDSAAIPVPPARKCSPTAVHELSDEHDTADRSLGGARTGAAWIDQLDPFQRSISGPPFAPPMMVQAVGDGHDTPVSALLVAPGGFGVGSIDQLVPSAVATVGLRNVAEGRTL